MEMHLVFQGLNDPPRLSEITQPIADLTQNPAMTVCLIQGGMQSGEPSVIIVSEETDGSVCLQTSLDKWLMAAIAFVSYAEERWGWKRPEGFATLMPMEKEQRKALLQQIQKELEEWED